jgi:hypothetical protein
MKTGMEMVYIDTGMECAFWADGVGNKPSLTSSPLHLNFICREHADRLDRTALVTASHTP